MLRAEALESCPANTRWKHVSCRSVTNLIATKISLREKKVGLFCQKKFIESFVNPQKKKKVL